MSLDLSCIINPASHHKHSSPQDVHWSLPERGRAYVRRGKAPIKTGLAETDKGQPGKPNVRARWVAKEYKTYARPDLYASTPPLEALKVVLSEVPRVNVEEKSWHWLTCEGRTSTLHHEEECSSKCRQKRTRQVMNTRAGCCNTACTARATLHIIGGQSLHRHSSDLKLTRGMACPCVWQGCIKGKHIVATLHRDDITIGGERSVVEFLVKKILRKYEVKKQVIGEDADLWKSGRILNRVIDGITNKRQVKMRTSRRLKLS